VLPVLARPLFLNHLHPGKMGNSTHVAPGIGPLWTDEFQHSSLVFAIQIYPLIAPRSPAGSYNPLISNSSFLLNFRRLQKGSEALQLFCPAVGSLKTK
jgi:hypothetical protein